jgi:hypothetical protein
VFFAEHDDVHVGIALQGADDSRHRLGGAKVDVEVEQLPHLEDGGLEALYAGLGGDGGHEGGVALAKDLSRFLGNGVALRVALGQFEAGLGPHAPAHVCANPVDRKSHGLVHGLQDDHGAFHDVETGIVSGDVGDLVARFRLFNFQHVAVFHPIALP